MIKDRNKASSWESFVVACPHIILISVYVSGGVTKKFVSGLNIASKNISKLFGIPTTAKILF